MRLSFKKFGIAGAAAGLLVTGCMEPMGPAAGNSQIHGTIQKTSARTASDSASGGLSVGRTGTVTLNATFKSASQ